MASQAGIREKTNKQKNSFDNVFSASNTAHIRVTDSETRKPNGRKEAVRLGVGALWNVALPDKAEPGTALLAILKKCQAQLPWLTVFHLAKNRNSVS